jgi:tripartite ATP-independent transporter DctP family solute receptor
MKINIKTTSPLATRRSLVTGLAGVAAAALTMPRIAHAAARIVRIGHNNTDDSHFGRGASAFAAAVAADPVLNGAITIEVHGNAELGDDLSMLNGCLTGTIDGMLCGSSIMGNIVPEIGLFNAPYLFPDVTHARAALDGPLGLEFIELAHSKSLPVLAWGENGLRHITANRPIRTQADLRGLRLRVPQSDVMLAGMRALGADAAPLSFTLLRDALRSGEFQAQENAIVLVEASKLYEVQKCLSLTGHIYDAIGFICSADLLDELTAPQRAALTTCAQKGALVTREVADMAQRNGIARLRALGMTVVEDIDVAGLTAASRPFLESLSGKYGADRIKRMMEASA